MKAQPHNFFYLLLLIASVAFAITAVSYAFPMDMMPGWLQAHGWKLLLWEVAAVIIFGLASMALDRFRSGVRRQESGVKNQQSGVDPQAAHYTRGD